MKEKFLKDYELLAMCKSSIKVMNKYTGEICYIHRNAFNSLHRAVDYRETLDTPDARFKWIEVLSWNTI